MPNWIFSICCSPAANCRIRRNLRAQSDKERIILRNKEKDSQHSEKGGTGKRKAGVILAISLFPQIPLIVMISGAVISSAVRKTKEIKSYEALISPYEGREPEWFSCDAFADIHTQYQYAADVAGERQRQILQEYRAEKKEYL